MEEGLRQDALMDQRNEKIRKRKLARRKIDSSDEEVDPEIVLALQKKNPYQRLSMQQPFTPPCKKPYLIHFYLEICHFFLEILHTFTGIFLSVLRSEVSFSDGGTFLF